MKKPTISTLKELKKSGYKTESIKDELKRNLTQVLKDGKKTFEKIHGYEKTIKGNTLLKYEDNIDALSKLFCTRI